MALVRPSLILQELLTEASYSPLAEKEIKRSFIYIAQSDVKKLDAEQADDGNIMRLCIRLIKPYWDARDPEAEALWHGVMPKWLDNISRNLSTAMRAYNSVIHPFGIGRIAYQWVDFEFDNNITLRVRLVSNAITSDIPAIATHVRELCAAGAFGEAPIARIRIPSTASYELQMANGAATGDAETSELEDASDESSVRASDTFDDEPKVVQVGSEGNQDDNETLEGDMPEADGEMPEETGELSEEVGGTSDDDALTDVEVSETEAEEENSQHKGQGGAQARGLPDVREKAQALDFSIWGIEYEDGTIAEFDSIKDTFLA